MVIKQMYSPAVAGEISGESLIFKRGVGPLFEEVRQTILMSKLYISPVKTKKKGDDATGNPQLSDRLNKGIAISLESLGWKKRQAPGATQERAELDWVKEVPSPLKYGPKAIGLGVEVQFGNNYQFNEDLKRLSEAILDHSIVAGVCVVASDELAQYKADRGASFSDSRSKLDRFLGILQGVGAAIIPPFVLIGVGHDGFTEVKDGKFLLEVPAFDPKKTAAGVFEVAETKSCGTL